MYSIHNKSVTFGDCLTLYIWYARKLTSLATLAHKQGHPYISSHLHTNRNILTSLATLTDKQGHPDISYHSHT